MENNRDRTFLCGKRVAKKVLSLFWIGCKRLKEMRIEAVYIGNTGNRKFYF